MSLCYVTMYVQAVCCCCQHNFSFFVHSKHSHITCRAEPGTAELDTVLREIYVLYSDCALVRNAKILIYHHSQQHINMNMPHKLILFSSKSCVLLFRKPHFMIYLSRRIHFMSWKCLYGVNYLQVRLII